MKKEIVIQNLCSAFDVIKDSWETRKDAICRCITGTMKYDPAIAMDMWLYILTSHQEEILTEEGCEKYVDEVCSSLFDDIADGSYSRTALVIYKSLFQNTGLYRKLYGESYFSDGLYYKKDFCELCLACYITEENPENLLDVLKLLSKNRHLKNYTMGLVVTKAINNLDDIRLEDEERHISERGREILLSCTEFIEDPSDKAEVTIAALSA